MDAVLSSSRPIFGFLLAATFPDIMAEVEIVDPEVDIADLDFDLVIIPGCSAGGSSDGFGGFGAPGALIPRRPRICWSVHCFC